MEAMTASVIEWNVATRSLDGDSGDQYLVQPFAHGALVAVADGLGHGREAAAAARTAMAVLEAEADRPVATLLRRCHEQLRSTRGAVLTLASFNALDGTMAWLGVGSVDGVLLRANPAIMGPDEHLVLRNGVVGGQLPQLGVAVVRVARGDTLILATDGVREGFAEKLTARGAGGPVAERILAEHAKGTDDALVMVARYRGGLGGGHERNPVAG